jgi:hypothetical protein
MLNNMSEVFSLAEVALQDTYSTSGCYEVQ